MLQVAVELSPAMGNKLTRNIPTFTRPTERNLTLFNYIEISETQSDNPHIQEIKEYEMMYGAVDLHHSRKHGLQERYLWKKLQNCAKTWMLFFCNDCSEVSVKPKLCHNKLCYTCNAIKRWTSMDRYRPYVATFKQPRFMTLTFKNVIQITEEYIRKADNHYKNLKKTLRRRGYRIERGIMVIECTEKGNGFHYHFHILYDGSYIPQQVIAKEWERITGDSKVVDIRSVKKQYEKYQKYCYAHNIRPKTLPDYMLSYILQYFYKKNTFSTIENELTWYKLTKGKRIINMIGSDKKILEDYNIVIPQCPVCKSFNMEYLGDEKIDDINDDYKICHYFRERYTNYFHKGAAT